MNVKTVEIDKKSKKLENINSALSLLLNFLDDFKDEVSSSKELLTIDIKSELSKSLEQQIENPVSSLIQNARDLNIEVRKIMFKVVSGFLIKNKTVVKKAVKSKNSSKNIHISVVLHEDNIKNREKILSFFDKYDRYDLSSEFPVNFQFVPERLMNKIRFEEEIQLN